MVSSVNQYEAPNVRDFDTMQASVSPFYASASNTQYANLSLNMPMDREIGHATTSYLANYLQPSYHAPYATNVSSSCATGEIHNLAPHSRSDHGWISENLTGTHISSNVACGLHSFKEQVATVIKEVNDIYLRLAENPHDPTAIQAYEAHRRKIEEQCE